MIDVESLSFSYVSELTGDRVEALHGVDVSVRPGTLTLVCGSSGCGKSTLMRALTGLVPQMTPGELDGVVRIDGRDLAEVPLTEVGHLCSSVFQNPRTQFFCDTVSEELAFCGENYGRDHEALIEESTRAAELMGISHLMDRKLSSLSGGQLQKVALACALASGAPVLLADEPTSNLDPDAIADVRRALAILKEQGMTIVVVEHRLHFLRGLADQVLLMEGGEVTRAWSGEEFYAMDDAQRQSLGLRTLVDPGPPEAWVPSRNSDKEASHEGGVRLSCRDLSFSYGNTPRVRRVERGLPGRTDHLHRGNERRWENDPRARFVWAGRSRIRDDHPGRAGYQSSAAPVSVRARHAGHRTPAFLRHACGRTHDRSLGGERRGRGEAPG